MLEREAKVWTTGFNGVAPIWNGTSTNPVTIIAPAELMRIATETKGTLDNGAHPDEKRFDALVCLGCVQHAAPQMALRSAIIVTADSVTGRSVRHGSKTH